MSPEKTITPFGILVRLDATEFVNLVAQLESPLVICGEQTATPQYMTNYAGFSFLTTPTRPLPLPRHAELLHTADCLLA
ncbi:MAG: hypothetical protein KDD89_07370 [Anaerolineales bacterium]|nr:hypothetical protein [Anaerolineales bacterium]